MLPLPDCLTLRVAFKTLFGLFDLDNELPKPIDNGGDIAITYYKILRLQMHGLW